MGGGGVDVDARVHIFKVTTQVRGRVASPMLGHLYPCGNSGTQFTRGWVDPRTCLDMKEWRKISDTQDRTWAIQLIVKHLAAWATWLAAFSNTYSKFSTSIIFLFFFLFCSLYRASVELWTSLIYCILGLLIWYLWKNHRLSNDTLVYGIIILLSCSPPLEGRWHICLHMFLLFHVCVCSVMSIYCTWCFGLHTMQIDDIS